MAATTAENRYGQGAVYGSLAYDFNNPELYPDEYSAAPAPAARPRTGVKTGVHTQARPVVHSKQGIAPLSLVGVLAAAFLFVIAITAQAQLISLSADSVSLQQEQAELEDQQAKLRISYESAFNLSDIEDYAVHSLGMQKPKADQICYIDTSAPDKAVIIGETDDAGFVDRVSDFISGFGAYLH